MKTSIHCETLLHPLDSCPDPIPTHTFIHIPLSKGALSEADVAELSPRFKGWLYLCTDAGEDTGWAQPPLRTCVM